MDTESTVSSSPQEYNRNLIPARLKSPLPRSSLSQPPQTSQTSPVPNEPPNVLPITVSNASAAAK